MYDILSEINRNTTTYKHIRAKQDKANQKSKLFRQLERDNKGNNDQDQD